MASSTLIVLISGLVFASGKICEFNGVQECESGCLWTAANIWRNCENAYPSVGDTALITMSGTYNILVHGFIEVDSFFLGTMERNETQTIVLKDKATLIINHLSTITKNGALVMQSASTLGGSGKLVNQGKLASKGELAFITLLELENFGEMRVSSGSLSIFSNFNTSGVLDVSMGEELFLFGNRTLINGKVFLGVDGLLANPIHSNGTIVFGPEGVFHVEVIGTVPAKEFSELRTEGDLFLGGSIAVKLRRSFMPRGHIRLPFVSASKKLIGQFDKTTLDTTEWESSQCIKCTFSQDDNSFGLDCAECGREYQFQEEFDSAPFRVRNFLPYLLPMVALVFVSVMAVVGMLELYSCLVTRRRQDPDQEYTLSMPV